MSWLHKERFCCTVTSASVPRAFLKAVEPYRQDLVVAVECIFSWYWLADLCAQEGIKFILGHALYMKVETTNGLSRPVNESARGRLGPDACLP